MVASNVDVNINTFGSLVQVSEFSYLIELIVY